MSMFKKYMKVKGIAKIRIKLDFTLHMLEKADRLLHKLPLKTLTN